MYIKKLFFLRNIKKNIKIPDQDQIKDQKKIFSYFSSQVEPTWDVGCQW